MRFLALIFITVHEKDRPGVAQGKHGAVYLLT